jgi:hypothetical protein
MPYLIGEVDVTNEVSLAPSAVLYDGAVTADGDLTIKVNAFFYDIGGVHGKYLGAINQAVPDNTTSYVYLDDVGALAIDPTSYPVTDHIRLGRVVTSGGIIVRVMLERAFFTAGNAMSGFVPTSRHVDTEHGLQGGGALSSNLLLSPVYGTAVETVCQGNDSRLSDARAPTSHASTHQNGGSDEVATATATANSIPKTGAATTLAIGWIPTGSSSSTVCIGNDSRLSDARTPTAHKTSHEPGGTDAMAVDATALTGSLRTLGTSATSACAGNDSRLSDTRTPSAHAASHQNGGGDEVATATAAANSIPKTGVATTLAIGWIPTGSTNVTVCIGNDSRLSDARTPTSHASSHNAGGGDALAIDAVAATGSLRTLGTAATSACAGNDARLSDARTPSAHATSHQNGGSDEVSTATPTANSIPKTGAATTLGIGWIPTGSSSTTVCIGNDARLSDARTPTSHASTHNSGGADALAIDAAAATGSLRTLGTSATSACAGNDARLSDARTPSTHATSHAAGGTDATTPKEYAALAADPSSPAPANGDRYFNTPLREDMVYDNARAKWLSVSDLTVISGASGDTSAGSYYRGVDGLSYGTNRGHPVPKGTLVGIGLCKTDSNTTPLEVLVDTTVIATLTVTAAGLTVDWTVNADFSQGQMKFRNKSSGGATSTNVQITAIIKRRA